ncbi:hypothetical protein [Ornithinimicrobium pekingense]|uniref:Uncharacterized protein n=1 Tax=Ornithinimicrobium pekingense TaxID=384677 RepID=A0ABQ2F6F0_9MICO|nr:hypothetical protein [Ornithinimicrobium pekingense]GGK57660.1 hypothetical protein GCM10011509_02580 [Ornithinimicrobium pekingense]
MTTNLAGRSSRPHVFHRRHNTRPRAPMPPPHRVGATPRVERTGDLADRQPDLLLADLTSPWAYLAHLRAGDGEEGAGAPVWWAVNDTPRVPLAGSWAPGPARELRRRELEAVRDAALADEQLPDDVPVVIPHPRPVAAAYAEGVELGRGPAVRELLLRAYWEEGRDIGDPEVLRRLLPAVLVDDRAPCSGDPRREWGYVVSPAREPLSDGAYHLLRRWQRRWTDLGRPGPLTLLGRAGEQVGAAALEALSRKDLSGTVARPRPGGGS